MKSKNQIKRILSLALSGMLAVSSAITVSAAGTKQNCVISSFETFADYVNTDGNTLPEGYKTSISPLNGNPWMWSGAADETTGMKTLKYSTQGQDKSSTIVRSFDEVIRKGKVHFSFDAKIDTQMYISSLSGENGDNPNDTYTENGNGAQLMPLFFATKGETDLTFAYVNKDWSPSTTENEFLTTTSDEWHKYDLFFDLDQNKMYGYCDGQKLGKELDFNIGLKCIAFAGKDYTVDNVSIHHYVGDASNDNIRAAAEYHEKDNKIYLNTAFSEYVRLSDRIPTYTVKNTVTGATVTEGVSATKSTVSGYDFVFENLDGGEYEITFGENAIKGVVTNSYLTTPVKFYTSGQGSDGSDRRYYVNETFDSYKVGMPAGWQRGINYYENAQGSNESNHLIESVERDNGSALKLSYSEAAKADNNSIAYRFGRDIYSGKFTVEFDVKGEQSTSWGVGLLTAAEFEPSSYNTTGAETSNWAGSYKDLKDRMNKSYIMTNGNNGYADNAYVSPDGGWGWQTYGTGIIPTVDDWTTIKIDVDLNNGTYTFYQNGEKKNTVAYGDGRYGKRVLKNAAGDIKYMHGISAIRFVQANYQAPLYIDNVKVYTDKSYNAYDTFDDTVTDKKLAQQMSYYSMLHPDWVDNNVTLGGDGKGAEVGAGGALRIPYGHKGSNKEEFNAVYRFTTPVKAGNSFDIDFDLKTTDENRLRILLFEECDLYPTTANSNYGGSYYNHWRVRNSAFWLGRTVETTANLIGIDRAWDEGNIEIAKTKSGENIVLTPNQWNHVKFSVINDGTKSYFAVSITGEDGVTKTAQREVNAKYNTTDIYAFAMQSYDGWLNENSMGFDGTIDNIVVKEHNNFPQGKVTAINGIGFDDSVTPISADSAETPSIPQGKHIEVKFNTPLKSQESAAKTIKAYYGDDSTAVSTSVELSEDKRSAYVTLNNAEANKNIVLEVGNKTEFANSYLTTVDTTSRTFKLSELPEQGVVVSDLRFYKYVGARYQGYHAKAEGAWVPVNSLSDESVADYDVQETPTHTNEGGFKLVVEGYNPGAATKIFVTAADYNVDNDGIIELKNIPINQVIDIESGKFKQEILLPESVLSKDELSKTVSLNIAGNALKAYAWQYPSARPTVETEVVK